MGIFDKDNKDKELEEKMDELDLEDWQKELVSFSRVSEY